MAKKPKEFASGVESYPGDEQTAAAELPPPADPQPNGDPVHPAQPAQVPGGIPPGAITGMAAAQLAAAKRERRPRDPNAPRPLYLLVAVDNDTQRVRLLGTAPTVGQASKLVPAVSYGIERGENGPFILRCKLVSAVGRRTRKDS